MRSSLLALTAAIAPLAFADVQITSPAAGAQFSSGAVTVTWTDGSGSPALDLLTTYTIQLMVGGNTESNSLPVAVLTSTGQFSAGNSLQGTIDPGVAGPTPNGFYLKITSIAKEGGQVINFSDRFSIPSMAGTTPPQFVQAAQALNGATAGPQAINQVNQGAQGGNGGAGGAAGGAAGDTALPYNEQTGLTKYAPMQPIPPTKITAVSYTPLFPTSAYTVATTWVALPSIQTTITASQTYSVSSMENTAAPQSHPTGDMARFLARWKD